MVSRRRLFQTARGIRSLSRQSRRTNRNASRIRRGPKRVPYDVLARDADGDGLLQEGTIWERPVGARYVDASGKEPDSLVGAVGNNFRLINTRGEILDDFIPSWQKPGEHENVSDRVESPQLPTLQDFGIPSIGDQLGTIEDSLGTIGDPIPSAFSDERFGNDFTDVTPDVSSYGDPPDLIPDNIARKIQNVLDGADPDTQTDEGLERTNRPPEPSSQAEIATAGVLDLADLERRLSELHQVRADLYQSASPDSEGNPRIVLARVEVPEDRRNQGTGTAFMEDLIEWADENGFTITLTPDDAFGGSVRRLNDFYKRFGFIDNTGRDKDFAISETMYRLPQETTRTIDEILDKTPQSQVLSVNGGKFVPDPELKPTEDNSNLVSIAGLLREGREQGRDVVDVMNEMFDVELRRRRNGQLRNWDHPGRVDKDSAQAQILSEWRSDFSNSIAYRNILSGNVPAKAFDNDTFKERAEELRKILAKAPELDTIQWRTQIAFQDYKIGDEIDFPAVSVATDRKEAEGFLRSTDVFGNALKEDRRILIEFPKNARGVYHDDDGNMPQESIVTGKYRVVEVVSDADSTTGRPLTRLVLEYVEKSKAIPTVAKQ